MTDLLDALLTLPDYSALAWSAIIFSTYLTGISKGGFAGGFGSLSVPLMALAIGPLEAAGILLPLLLLDPVSQSRLMGHYPTYPFWSEFANPQNGRWAISTK